MYFWNASCWRMYVWIPDVYTRNLSSPNTKQEKQVLVVDYKPVFFQITFILDISADIRLVRCTDLI